MVVPRTCLVQLLDFLDDAGGFISFIRRGQVERRIAVPSLVRCGKRRQVGHDPVCEAEDSRSAAIVDHHLAHLRVARFPHEVRHRARHRAPERVDALPLVTDKADVPRRDEQVNELLLDFVAILGFVDEQEIPDFLQGVEHIRAFLEQAQSERLHRIERQRFRLHELREELLADGLGRLVDAGRAVHRADDLLHGRVRLFADELFDGCIAGGLVRVHREITEAVRLQDAEADGMECADLASRRRAETIAELHRGFARECQHEHVRLREVRLDGEHPRDEHRRLACSCAACYDAAPGKRHDGRKLLIIELLLAVAIADDIRVVDGSERQFCVRREARMRREHCLHGEDLLLEKWHKKRPSSQWMAVTAGKIQDPRGLESQRGTSRRTSRWLRRRSLHRNPLWSHGISIHNSHFR